MTADDLDRVRETPLILRQLMCATEGHFTVQPTGNPMRCLRCGVMLDGLGFDPRLSEKRGES